MTIIDARERPNPRFPPPDLSPRVHGASYFFLRQESVAARKLALVCGGREHCNRDYELQRSRFEYFGIEWVESGAGTVKLDGRRSELRPGSVFAYGPTTQLEIYSAPDRPMTKSFLDLRGRVARATLTEARLAPGALVFYPQIAQLSELFDGLAGSIKSDHAGIDEIALEYLRLLLLKVKLGQADQRHRPVGADYELYVRSKRLIVDCARELGSLSEACARINCSAAYLCRLFKRFDSTSPYQFLLRTKMNLALQALTPNGVLVKQAAAAAGYEDPQQFSRLFSKIHGVSPSDMQQLLRRIGRAEQ